MDNWGIELKRLIDYSDHDPIVRVCRAYLDGGEAAGQPFVDKVNLIGLPGSPPYFDELVYVLMLRGETVDLLTQLAPIDWIVGAIGRLIARGSDEQRGAPARRSVSPRYVVRLAAADTSRRLWTAYDCLYTPDTVPGSGFVAQMLQIFDTDPPVGTAELAAAFQTIAECYDPPRRVYETTARLAAQCVIRLVAVQVRGYAPGVRTELAILILDTFIRQSSKVRVWLSDEILTGLLYHQDAYGGGRYTRQVGPLISRAEPNMSLLVFVLDPYMMDARRTSMSTIRTIAEEGGNHYAESVAAWLAAYEERWQHTPLPKLEYAD